MRNISNLEIIDVVRYDDNKAILVEKRPVFDDSNRYKVGYFVINFDSGEKEIITKKVYLRKKFGVNYERITEQLGNYVQCEAFILSDKSVLTMYPTGPAGQFGVDGELVSDSVISYNDNEVFGLAPDGDYFWTCCPKENCVIRFDAKSLEVDIRIGGKDYDTFSSPSFATADDKNIYVVCDGSHVRKIDKNNFTVTDVDKDYSNLCQYHQFGEYAIICTNDGAYLDNV